MKIKTYVLTVSRYFPKTHKRDGESTGFISKIIAAVKPNEDFNDLIDPKLHTLIGNYELWAKRIKEVQEGKAILSLRYRSGKPYNSKQIEFCQLDKDSGIGIDRIDFIKAYPSELTSFELNNKNVRIIINGYREEIERIAKNDGLSLEDFEEWFKGYDLSEPMAVIHFTPFRY